MDKSTLLIWPFVLVAGCIAGTLFAAETLAPVKIELPQPFFGGTPLDYWSSNLEPKSTEPRKPFMAPEGVGLISGGKPVSMDEDAFIYSGELKQLVDGSKDYFRENLIEMGPGTHWVQVDIEKEHAVHAVVLWHFHEGQRVYFDVVIQVSNDPKFEEGVTTLFNNDVDNSSKLGEGKNKEYIESYEGRLFDAKGAKGRYVRCYSNGNTASDLNHYIELEVYGKALE